MLYKLKKIADALAYPLYLLTGRKPWKPGYFTARRRLIVDSIHKRLLADGRELPAGHGSHMDERVVEYPWVFSHLKENPGAVLDAGSALNHDFLVGMKPLANGKLTICTLAPEKRCYFERGISYVYDDLRRSPFRDDRFDTVISISTIEHIGLDNTMLYTADTELKEQDDEGYIAAVREFRRVLKSEGDCYITVPYGKAAVRGWFQLFDAVMVEKLLEAFQPANAKVEYFAYREDGWQRTEPDELTEASFFDIHQDTPYDDDFAGGARAVVCIHLRK